MASCAATEPRKTTTIPLSNVIPGPTSKRILRPSTPSIRFPYSTHAADAVSVTLSRVAVVPVNNQQNLFLFAGEQDIILVWSDRDRPKSGHDIVYVIVLYTGQQNVQEKES